MPQTGFFLVFAILDIIGFIFCLKLISPLKKIKSERHKLEETEQKSKEDEFKYKSLSNQNWILQADNINPNLPKNLFYERKVNNQLDNINLSIPIITPNGQYFDKVICKDQ